MRKSQLRQQADRFLHLDNRGSHRDKLFRRFVIHNMIDSLFAIGDIPPKWHALTKEHIHQLVAHWHRKKIKPATIMKYMTVIRYFLQSIEHSLSEIDNKNLDLSRVNTLQINCKIMLDDLQKISEPVARTVLCLQAQFGLTFSEAIHLIPEIHIQENSLWLTREITSNSQDRIVPFRTDFQRTTLCDLSLITNNSKNIIDAFGYDAVRHAYKYALKSEKLPVKKCYRYLYARMIHAQLSSTLSHYQLTPLIMREMGLRSRTSLWGYLRE